MLNKKIALFFLTLAICCHSFADVSASRDTITIQGKLSNEDADRLVVAMNENVIKTVIFKNSPGGEWRAGKRIGSFLLGKNITTVVEGVCASSCATAFLGGDKRLFSKNGAVPILFFHVPYSPTDNKTIEIYKDQFFAWIESRTKQKISQKFVDAINGSVSIRGGVFFFSPRDPIVLSSGGVTQICKGNELRIPLDCEKTEEISAVSMGIVSED